VSADTVRNAIYGTMGLLYVAAWIEVVRMLYVRWWPHWGTLASGADPYQAAKTVIPAYIRGFALLAAVVSVVILGCDAFDIDRPRWSGALVGILSGVGGAVLVQYTAWFIRILEPFGPTSRSRPP
jgi:membrane associated rhomboid family serine protease